MRVHGNIYGAHENERATGVPWRAWQGVCVASPAWYVREWSGVHPAGGNLSTKVQ